MSEHDGAQAATKRRRSHKTSKQDDTLTPALQKPINDDTEAWKTYWKAQGQPWRWEPEIDVGRQKYLAERRSIAPNIEQGIYPFSGMKLSRADVEWLLATHEHGQGPVYWNNVHELKHEGLDIRGAELCQVDLRELPLACIRGGLTRIEWYSVTKENRKMAEKCAAVLMEGTDLARAHLEGADLRGAQFKGASFRQAYLEGVDLSWSQLKSVDFRAVHLEGADLYGAHLEGAYLTWANLEKVGLGNATLADDKHIGPHLADVRWEGVNLAVVNWSQVTMLGDENEARQRERDGVAKDNATRDIEYRGAVRANRQLAVALQTQGLNEDAARFAYRAQTLQRIVLRRQAFGPQVSLWQRFRNFSSYIFSLFLDLLAGYGYRPGRSIVAYLFIIFGFMGLYLLNSHLTTPHLRWDEALVLSVSSFHGRGFFSQNITLGDTYARLAAAEAVVGLIIEISFIATFTQRFFGK